MYYIAQPLHTYFNTPCKNIKTFGGVVRRGNATERRPL